MVTMIALLILPAILSLSNACTYPPITWCENDSIASKCRVTKQCSKKCHYEPELWCVQGIWEQCGVTAQCKSYAEAKWGHAVDYSLIYDPHSADSQLFITSVLNREPINVSKFSAAGVFNPDLVPFGNVNRKVKSDGTISYNCENEDPDCGENRVHLCAVKTLGGSVKAWPFILCMAKSNSTDCRAAAKQCLQDAKISSADQATILACGAGAQSNELMNEAYKKTEAAWPAQATKYPWHIMNGASVESIQSLFSGSFFEIICDAYRGTQIGVCRC